MRSSGPVIPAPGAAAPEELSYAAFGLERLRPTFMTYPEELRVLPVVKKIPDPETVDSSQPEIISFMFEIPGIEPEIAFPDFIRGVAVVALIMEPQVLPGVKESLLAVAEKVLGGGELPPISSIFQQSVKDVETSIFDNQEPVSWRPLLAFMRGAFWMLSYVKDPYVRRGRFTPMEFVDFRLTLSAQLGYTPK